MHGDHGFDALRPRADGASKRPGLEVGAKMSLGEKDDVEIRVVGLQQHVAREFEGGVHFARRQGRRRARDRARDRLGADGNMGNRRVKSKLHGKLPACRRGPARFDQMCCQPRQR